MLILTVRTDKPQAELGLYENTMRLEYLEWTAHRELAATLHEQIKNLLERRGKQWADIGGIVCFKGPGSFTGLRIGLTVANTLAYSYKIPIIAQDGEEWLGQGIERLTKGETEDLALPEYGAPAFTTTPKK